MKIYSVEHRFDKVVNGEVVTINHPVAYFSSSEKAMEFIQKYDDEHVYGSTEDEELKAGTLVYFEYETLDNDIQSDYEWKHIGNSIIPCLVRV